MKIPSFQLPLRIAQIILTLLAGLYLLYFFDHAYQLLRFAFPIDYGEGPLLAQVDRLRAGTPIWQLYGDPAEPPFQIVNYPPLYLLLTAGLAQLTGSPLLAGRLIGLIATLGTVIALGFLAAPSPDRRRPALLLALLFLSVPMVREWAVLMRVDMLGLCLGLWALLLLTREQHPGPRRLLAVGLLLTATLFVKPSLLAAPGAAALWLLWRLVRAAPEARRGAATAVGTLLTTMALVGGGLFMLFQWASGGWFALHVVAANANRWEWDLAQGFWRQQVALRWALGVAAVGSLVALRWLRRDQPLALPLLYTLLGVVTAAGVGKVGAYSNYFLELYAGLIWLTTYGLLRLAERSVPAGATSTAAQTAQLLIIGLLSLSMLYYPPLWDATRLRPAGLIEPSPPRLAFGRYGLWADMAREAELLAAQSRIGAALVTEVQAAGPRIFSDLPGTAAAAGVELRLQVFEARQLLDQGLADEQALLHELANGALPLAVIDYLGNWLTPGVITILQRSYAHDGSLGTLDLYRPIATGSPQPLAPGAVVAAGLELKRFSITPPVGMTYEPGELITLGLEWQRLEATLPTTELQLLVRLTSPEGALLLEDERPLLYDVYPATDWPIGSTVRHLQPMALPAELLDGRYQLEVGLRVAGEDGVVTQPLTMIEVEWQGGMLFEESGQFVPARLLQTWAELGAIERAGLPLTPVVPFAWGRLQCFEQLCLELHGDQVRIRPLGQRLYLAETTRGERCADGTAMGEHFCVGFATAPDRFVELGLPISGELLRNGWLVQWSEGARLERDPDGDTLRLGRLGEESLRLPPGTPYRWP
jgi:4-amino-4-deoxy-L-arabinose transferase-like glycosyltransferase